MRTWSECHVNIRYKLEASDHVMKRIALDTWTCTKLWGLNSPVELLCTGPSWPACDWPYFDLQIYMPMENSHHLIGSLISTMKSQYHTIPKTLFSQNKLKGPELLDSPHINIKHSTCRRINYACQKPPWDGSQIGAAWEPSNQLVNSFSVQALIEVMIYFFITTYWSPARRFSPIS